MSKSCKKFQGSLTRQKPYDCLTDRVIFFQLGFWPGPPVATPRSHRPVFFIFFLSRFGLKRQWPYHGLSDPVFFSKTFYTILHLDINDHTTVCETVEWLLMFRVENVLKMKKPGLWDLVMVTGGPGQKPNWKKMTQSVRQWYGHWWVNFDIRN